MFGRAHKLAWGGLLAAALSLSSGAAQALTICGDGVIAPGEDCEPPSTAFCDQTCDSVATPVCAACSGSACSAQVMPGCSPVGGAEGQRACYDVLGCVFATHCLGPGAGLLDRCYCGSLSPAACATAPAFGPGAPNGICAAVIQHAFGTGTTTGAEVSARLTDPSYPGSYANARLVCEQASCRAQCFPPAAAPASSLWSLAALGLALLGFGAPAARRLRVAITLRSA